MLVGKPASSTPQPALDFIRNQQSVVFLRQPVRRLRKLPAYGADPSFSLYELKADSADSVVKVALQIGNIVKFHELHAGKNGSKGRTILFLVRRGESAKGPAMESMLQRQDSHFGLAA